MANPSLYAAGSAYMAMIQAAHGTADTLTTSTDGILPYVGDGLPEPPPVVQYGYDGSAGRALNSRYAKRPYVTPVSKTAEFQFKAWFKGAGTAYTSSSVLPPNEVHLLLQAAGFAATFSTNKWVYTLEAVDTATEVLTFGGYRHGKEYLIQDLVANWSYAIEGGGGIPVHMFDMKGIWTSLPATAALPSVTYPYETVKAPNAVGAVMKIGSFVAPSGAKCGFSLNADWQPRMRPTNSDGHSGWVLVSVDPKMTYSIEQTALVNSPFHTSSGLDPYQLRAAMTGVTCEQGLGTSPNKWGLSGTNMQCTSVTESHDAGVPMWDLEFAMTSASTLTATVD